MIGVSLGIACNPRGQSFGWWSAVMAMNRYSAKHGIDVSDPLCVASADIGHNRSEIVKDFRHNSTNDWLMFIDDDTAPPVNALQCLLGLSEPYAAGVYFYKNEDKEHAPLIYTREPNGRYKPFIDYRRGEIVQVDSVGMGCTLIHRMVFEGILDHFDVGLRANGSTTLVRKGAPKRERPGIKLGKSRVLDRYDTIPFFVSEQGRTEDHWFAELAQLAGYKPVVDTMIECGHIGEVSTSGASFRALRARRRRERRVVTELVRARSLVA